MLVVLKLDVCRATTFFSRSQGLYFFGQLKRLISFYVDNRLETNNKTSIELSWKDMCKVKMSKIGQGHVDGFAGTTNNFWNKIFTV